MNFDPGFDIFPETNPLGFHYGKDCFGPEVEFRSLDAIRKSLRDPHCEGPEIVYAIAMDVGKQIHRDILRQKFLLYGAVTYAAGRLGQEPVRSQGHIHRISSHSGWSPPEIYEIWAGNAVIYMQESAKDNPGRCFAVYAEEGDIIVVPPGWAHATISVNPSKPLTFGAWCDREYGFEYDDVKAHAGLAWYPLLTPDNIIIWEKNHRYQNHKLIVKEPGDYVALGIRKGIPIYRQFEEEPTRFQFVSKPDLKKELWFNFVP